MTPIKTPRSPNKPALPVTPWLKPLIASCRRITHS